MKILRKLLKSRQNRNYNIVSIASSHLSYLLNINDLDYFSKYHMLFNAILKDSRVKETDILFVNEPIKQDIIWEAHSREYIRNIEERLLFGDFVFEDIHLDNNLYEIVKIFCNANLQASFLALDKGYAMLLGGGFHHALYDKPGGFCVLNDIAISVKYLLKESKINSALVLDLDVHQGDGTADILHNEEKAFTFSIHQEDNFPYDKKVSSLDISISSSDFKRGIYFYNLKNTINSLLKNKHFDILYYIAGADTLKEDKLGSFNLTLNDLKKRDSIIFKYAKDNNIPIVVLMGGGYNKDLNKEIEAYKNTLKLLWSYFL